MKITKENFHEVEGKKIQLLGWTIEYFIPKFVTKQRIHGINEEGLYECHEMTAGSWQFYTEPKKKVKLYPALYRRLDNKRFWLTQELYSSLTQALEAAKGKVLSDCITWPVESVCVEVEE